MWVHDEQVDLQHMVPLLNRLDTALEGILGEYRKSLILDDKGIEEYQYAQASSAGLAAENAKIILDFTCMLLKNAFNKEVYNSIQHLLAFTKAFDDELAALALEAVASLAVPPLTHRSITDERHHQTLMHKEERLSEPIFDILRASCASKRLPLKDLLTEFVDPSTFAGFEFSCSKPSTDRQRTDAAGGSFRIDDIDSLPADLPDALRQLVAEHAVPPEKQLELMWTLRMMRALRSYEGRVAFVRQHQQAIVTLLSTYPNTSVLASFFNDRADIFSDAIFLLQTGPGAADYDRRIPLEFRLLATQALVALVATRDLSGTVMGRLAWIQHELGVQRGQYMGLLPCILRASVSFLQLLSTDATLLDEQVMGGDFVVSFDYAASLDILRSLGGDQLYHGLQSSTVGPQSDLVENHPPRAETSERLLWIEAILTLTAALLASANTLAALVDSGLVSLLLAIIRQDVNPSRSNLHVYVEAQVVQVFEMAISHSSTAFAACRDQNGLEILVARLGKELDLLKDTVLSASTEPQLEVAGKGTPARAAKRRASKAKMQIEQETKSAAPVSATVPSSRSVLLYSLLSTISMYVHERAGTHLNSLTRSNAFVSTFKRIFDCADALGATIVAPAFAIIAEVINNEPSVLSFFLSVGLVASALQAAKRPREHSEWLQTLPSLLQAASLTTDGTAEVQKHNIFPAFFEIFHDDAYVIPSSRVLMGEVPSMLGGAFEELLRNSPALKPTCVEAAVGSLRTLVLKGSTYDADTCGPEFQAVLHHATNFATFLEQLVGRGGMMLEFVDKGGLPLLVQLVRVLMKPARYVLSSLGSVTDDAQPVVGHTPALMSIFRCLMNAGREQIQTTLDLLFTELGNELTALSQSLSAFDAHRNSGSSSTSAQYAQYANLLEKVPSDVLPVAFRDHPRLLRLFADICGKHVVLKMIVDALAALLTDRVGAGLRQDARRTIDEVLQREETMVMLRRFFSDVYVPIHQEICRARGPLQHEFPSVFPQYTLLVTSLTESIPVRAEPNDRAEKICRLERGTVVTSSLRQLTADNMVRYQIEQGWVNSSKSRGNGDSVLEVIDIQLGDPAQAIDEEAPLPDKLRQRDRLQLANASARRAGYVAFATLSYSVGNLVRSLTNICVHSEVHHITVRPHAEIGPYVTQLMPIFLSTLSSLLPPTHQLRVDEVNLMDEQLEVLPVTSLAPPSLDELSLMDISKVAEAVDFVFFLLSESHRSTTTTVNPLLLSHLLASGLLDRVLRASVAVFLCSLKQEPLPDTHSGSTTILDLDLDTFPEGEYAQTDQSALSNRLLKERRKLARLQLPTIIDLWLLVIDCNVRAHNSFLNALHDAADAEHEFDQHVLKREVQALTFNRLASIIQHEHLWTLPAQSVKKFVELGTIMLAKLVDAPKLSVRADKAVRRNSYRSGRRTSFLPDAETLNAVTTQGYWLVDVERAVHVLRSNDVETVTEYLRSQSTTAPPQGRHNFERLQHLLPAQPHFSDAALHQQQLLLGRQAAILSRSLPAMIVTLIERGVYRGSIRIGHDNQLLPPDVTREAMTAFLVQHLWVSTEQRAKRGLVAIVLAIATLTDRLQQLLASEESVPVVDHKLYGLLHALLLLLASKFQSNSTTRSYSPDAVVYITCGLPRTAEPLKQLAGVIEQRSATREGDGRLPAWIAPALLVFDVLCQPLVLPAPSHLRGMLTYPRAGLPRTIHPLDSALEEELSQFLSAAAPTSASSSDATQDLPSGDASVRDMLSGRHPWESENAALRSLFAYPERSFDRERSGRSDSFLHRLVMGLDDPPRRGRDQDTQTSSSSAPPKPAQLPLTETSLDDETLAKLFRSCQNVLSSPNDTLTPALVQAMLSLLVHLLRDLKLANEFRQWNGSTKLLNLSAAARFPGINMTLLSALQQAADNETDLLQAMEHAIRAYVVGQGNKRPHQPDAYQADLKRFVDRLSPVIYRNQDLFFKALSNTAKIVSQGNSLVVVVKESASNDESTSTVAQGQTQIGESVPVKGRKRRKSLSGGVGDSLAAVNSISDVVHVLAARVVQKWRLGTASDEELQRQPDDLHSYSIMNASEALSTLAELVLSMPGFATCIHKCNVTALVPDWREPLHSVVARERISNPTFLAFLVNGVLTVPASSLECKQSQSSNPAEASPADRIALKRARLLGQDLHISAKKLLLALCTRPGDGRRRTLQELLRALKLTSISAAPQPTGPVLASIGHVVGCVNDVMANKTSKYYPEYTEKLPAKDILRLLVGLRAHVILNELICILDVTDSAAAQLGVAITQPLEHLIRKGTVQVRIDDSAARKLATPSKANAQRASSGPAASSTDSPFRRPRSFTDDDRLSGSEMEATEQLEQTELPRRQEEYEEDVSSSDEEDEGDEHESMDDLHGDDEEDEDGEEDEDELDEEAEEFLQDAVDDELVFDDGNVRFVTAHVRVGGQHDGVDEDDDENEEGDHHSEDGVGDVVDGQVQQPMDDGHGDGRDGEEHGNQFYRDDEDDDIDDDDDGHDDDDDGDDDGVDVRVVMNFNFVPENEVNDEHAAFERASSQDDDGAVGALEGDQILEESEENAMEQPDDEASNLDGDEQDEDNSPLEVELPFAAEGNREVRVRAMDLDEGGLPNMIFSNPLFRVRRSGQRGHNFLSLPRPRSPPVLGQGRVTRPVRIRLGGELDDVHALLLGGDLGDDHFPGLRSGMRMHRHEVGLMDSSRQDVGSRTGTPAQLDPAFSDASDRRLDDHPLLQLSNNGRGSRARYASDHGMGGAISSLVGMLGGAYRHRHRGSGNQAQLAADARWGMHGVNRAGNAPPLDQLVHAVADYIRSTTEIGPDVADGPPRPSDRTRSVASGAGTSASADQPQQEAAMDIDQSETKDEGEQQETKEEGEQQETKEDTEVATTAPVGAATEQPMAVTAVAEPTAEGGVRPERAADSTSADAAAAAAPASTDPADTAAGAATAAEAAPAPLECPPDVDPEVFAELPEEMQRELVEQYRSQDAAINTLMAESSLDREMLAVLPDNIREEVLQEEAAERRRRDSIDGGAAAASSATAADPAAAQAAADIEFITSLPPDLRRDALLTASDEFLRALPEDIQRESRELRQRFRFQHALEGMEPMVFGGMGGTMAPHRYGSGMRRQRAGAEEALQLGGAARPAAPPVDPLTISYASNRKGKCPSGRLVLVQLLIMILRVPDGTTPRPLQRLLAALTRYEAARRTIVQLIVQILRAPDATQEVRRLLGFIPLDRRGALRAAKTTEQLESMFNTHFQTLEHAVVDRAKHLSTIRRLLGVLHYLCRKSDGLVSYEIMLPRKAPEHPGIDEWIFERIVQLLSHDHYDQGSNFLEYVVQLLAAPFTMFEKLDIAGASKLVELQIGPAPSDDRGEEAPPTAGQEASSSSTTESEPVKKKAKASAASSAPSTATSATSSINVEVSADQAQQDLTAMKQEAAAEEETRVHLVFPIFNSEIADNFCRLIASDHFHGVTRKNLTHILQIASLYEGNWRVLLSRLQDLASSILEQVMAETGLTLQVLDDILQQQGDSVVAMTAPQLANPTRVTELVLLQALQTMISLRPSDDDQHRVVASYMAQINFGRLWDDLSECLDRVRKLEGLQDAHNEEEAPSPTAEDEGDKKMDEHLHGSLTGLTMRFMPLIECFFLVVSATLQSKALNVENTQHRKRGREEQEEDEAATAAAAASGTGMSVGDDSKESEPEAAASTAEASGASPLASLKVQPYIPGERFRQSPEFQQMQLEVGSDSNGLRLISFVQRNRALLNMVLRQNPHLLEGSFAPIIKIPRCRRFLHFDIKRAFFKSKMRKIKHSATRQFGTLRVAVRRSKIFEDSFSELRRASTDDMRKRLSVIFHGEEGVDAGGVTREWYSVLAREIFNENYALFRSTHDGVTFQPNPLSYVNKDHLDYFRFVGRIIGKAVCDGHLLDAHFTRSFYKHMLGVPVTYHDVEGMDPEYYKNLQQILEYPLDDLGLDLTFSAEASVFGQVEIVDLIPDGRNIPVTDENKMDYVRLITHHRMTSSIQPQIDAFLEGFHDLVPPELISIFNEHELELLISGLPDIDLEDLRANTDYHGYRPTDDQIAWFWSALKSFSREEQALFLQFVTGTSKVPLEGFVALQGMRGPQKFNIHKAFGSHLLPTAHTCFNQLDLPSYGSEEETREKLLLAIKEGSEGFAFA